MGVLVHAANIQDADSAGALLSRITGLYCWLHAVFADSIDNRLSLLLVCFLLGLTLIIVCRIAGTGFVVLPRRWVVESLRDHTHPCRHPPQASLLGSPETKATAADLTCKTGCGSGAA